MNGQRGAGKKTAGGRSSGGARPGSRTPRGAKNAAPRTAKPARRPEDSPPPPPPGPFRLGAVAGATPGKWIDTWKQRMPQHPLELVALAGAEQTRALHAGEVDAAIVRRPLDADGLHVIALYDEQPVVVCARESHLTAADELTAADLEGETLIVPADDVLSISVPGTLAPRFPQLETTADTIATVATGIGIAVVPMSLARLHQRKDVVQRPLVDGPVSSVALAWVAGRDNPLVETFIGIVRGRTANSSRG